MTRNRGKHAQPSTTSTVAKNAKRAAAVTGALAVSTPVALFVHPGTAQAVPTDVWELLASCESSGNWSSTVGMFDGGLQFLPSTWTNLGGGDFAPTADRATKDQQIFVAEKALAEAQKRKGIAGGWAEQWPACSSKLGLRGYAADTSRPVPGSAPAAPPAPVAPAPAAPATNGVTGQQIVDQARKYIGAKYLWGGDSLAEGGFDCSGLLYRVAQDLGLSLDRVSRDQADDGTLVNSIEEALPGDLLFYDPNGDGVINHAAIYVGNGRQIDSSDYGIPVQERNIKVPVVIRRLATGTAAPAPAPAANPPTADLPVAEAPTEEIPIPEGRVEAEFTHTVAQGEWLSSIAQDRGICGPEDDIKTCWEDFAAQNADVVPDPDVIYPGQQLRYAGLVLASVPVPAAQEFEEASGSTAITEAPAAEAPAAEAPAAEAPAAEAPAAEARVVDPLPGKRQVGSGMGDGRGHMGLDLPAPLGTPIYAAVGGEVISSGSANGFGNWIRIRSEDNVVFVYGHMRAEDLFVNVGDVVKAGDLISKVGSEGQSTGPHLHIEVRPNGGAAIDPYTYFAELGVNL